jgi:hypothetical protein
MTDLDILVWLVLDLMISFQYQDKYYQGLVPHIYNELRTNENLCIKKFIVWEAYGIYSAAICFFVPAYGFNYMGSSANKGSKDNDLEAWLLCAFTIMILVHAILIIIFTRNVTYVVVISYILNIMMYCPICMVMNNNTPSS